MVQLATTATIIAALIDAAHFALQRPRPATITITAAFVSIASFAALGIYYHPAIHLVAAVSALYGSGTAALGIIRHHVNNASQEKPS